jgi:glycosyltransferase involved in cell wall biosynthesis
MTPKVSIVIPVYKAERYLRKCVESVLAQTFTDFECILVDDKSPDSSGAICEEYAAKDDRVRVIRNRSNQGASLARKTGLSAAKGEYVQFADSDDYLEPTMIEKLYRRAIQESADMVYCDYIEHNNNGQILRKLEYADRLDRIRRLIDGSHPLHVYLWNKLVKKEIYDRVDFPGDLCGHEDVYIMAQAHYFSQKALYLNEPCYHYNRQNTSSMTNNVNLALRLDMYNNLRYIETFLLSRFDNDLTPFEPYFSRRVNKIKHDLLKAGFYDLKTLKTFHPQADSQIFQTKGLKFKHKLFLYLALKRDLVICYKLFCRRKRAR